MIDPTPLKVAGLWFGFHVPSLTWRSDRTPWRIRHDVYNGWHAYNLDTRETLTTSSQSLRQLRTVLALKIRRQEP